MLTLLLCDVDTIYDVMCTVYLTVPHWACSLMLLLTWVHSNIDIDIRANRDEWKMSRQIYTDISYEDYHRSSKLVAFLPLSR